MYTNRLFPRLAHPASDTTDAGLIDALQHLIVEMFEELPQRPNLAEAVMALSGLLIACLDRAQPDQEQRHRLAALFARAVFRVDEMPTASELLDADLREVDHV